jgi:hypothetical protein
MEYLESIDTSSLLTIIVTALLGLSVFIEITPIKLNPWSWLFKILGKAINSDVTNKLSTIEKKLDSHIETDDKRTIDNCRAQILHFNNELLRPIKHTKEEFIEILAKIDEYEKYCKSHPDYPNNRAELAIENIRETYKERLKKRDFIQDSVSDDEINSG